MIQPTASFKENLDQMPSIEAIQRIDLTDASGGRVATIENVPGKQGSVRVYNYLAHVFGRLDAEAAAHGLIVFAEHTADAKQRPGAHPNIDRLFQVIEAGSSLTITPVAA